MDNRFAVPIMFFLMIMVLNSGCSMSSESPQKIKNYGVIHVSYLMNDLSNNPAAAKQKYQNTNWVIEGCVASISADGNILVTSDPNYYIYGVACLIDQSDKMQLDFVTKLKVGQKIKAFGTISDVIEDIGYVLRVDKFK